MSVFKYFKIYPGRPPIGRQAQCVIFFLQICNEVPGGKKKGRGLSPVGGATGPFFFRHIFFPGTNFELFERVFVIIVGKISAANSYRT